MSKIFVLFITFTILSQAEAAETGAKTVIKTPANQILTCDASASEALAKMDAAIKDLQSKASAAEQRVREIPGFEHAIFPVRTAIGENMRNVFEIRVFIYLPQMVRAMLVSGPYSTPELAALLSSNVETTIQFPYGSCVRTSGDAKPLI